MRFRGLFGKAKLEIRTTVGRAQMLESKQSWEDPGLAYDHPSNVLYAVDGVTDALYRIHPTTAVPTLIGPLGINAAGGLAFVVE